MKEQLLALLNDNFPEIDFTESNALVDDGILESIVLVEIISTISLEMGILIPYEEIVPQNFNSPGRYGGPAGEAERSMITLVDALNRHAAEQPDKARRPFPGPVPDLCPAPPAGISAGGLPPVPGCHSRGPDHAHRRLPA